MNEEMNLNQVAVETAPMVQASATKAGMTTGKVVAIAATTGAACTALTGGIAYYLHQKDKKAMEDKIADLEKKLKAGELGEDIKAEVKKASK